MRLPVRTGRERTTRVAVVPVPLTRGLGTQDGHAWGRSGTSGRHRLAHGNPKRRIFSAGTKLRSMSPVPWPPRVLTGATLWRRPYQSLSRMRCDAGSIATSKTCGYIVFETGDPLEALTIGEQRNGAIRQPAHRRPLTIVAAEATTKRARHCRPAPTPTLPIGLRPTGELRFGEANAGG